jgi:hypothetical protein
MRSPEDRLAVVVSQEVHDNLLYLGCRVLETFDACSSWFQRKHTWEKVFHLHEDYSLEDLSPTKLLIAVQRRSPLNPRSSPQGEVE